MASLDELKQGIDKKWQFVPKTPNVTENPETFETKCVYSVEGALSTENGHPYDTEWDHITYLVYGDSHENGEGYKNIIAINHTGRILIKSQGWNWWNDWKEIINMNSISEVVLNPNIFINPNFKINQRGQSIYTAAGYTVDRWRIYADSNIKVGNGYIELPENFAILQLIENFDDFIGKPLTFSASTNKRFAKGTLTINANSQEYFYTGSDFQLYHVGNAFGIYSNTGVVVYWMKLELGMVATQFVPPSPAEELLKCQRYYYRWNSIRTEEDRYYVAFPSYGLKTSQVENGNFNMTIQLPVPMRTFPTISFDDITGYCYQTDNWFDITNIIASQSYSEKDNKMIHLIFYSNENLPAGIVYCELSDSSRQSYLAFDAEIY